VLGTGVALVETRLELVAVEFEEQVAHASGLLLWAVVSAVLGFLTLLLLAATIILAAGETHRLLAATIVTGVLGVGTLAAVTVLRRRLRRRPRFLSATRQELRDDARALGEE
jgi:uncharacterized membrane protein YqjE